MVKFITLVMCFLGICLVANAQVDYTFTASGGTYIPLSGATSASLVSANPGGRPLLDEAFVKRTGGLHLYGLRGDVYTPEWGHQCVFGVG